MLKKISLAAILAVFSLSLIGCGDDNASGSTGIKECDEYIATVNKYVEKANNEAISTEYKKAVKDMQEAIKKDKNSKDIYTQQCKALNDAMKSLNAN